MLRACELNLSLNDIFAFPFSSPVLFHSHATWRSSVSVSVPFFILVDLFSHFKTECLITPVNIYLSQILKFSLTILWCHFQVVNNFWKKV